MMQVDSWLWVLFELSRRKVDHKFVSVLVMTLIKRPSRGIAEKM